MTAGPDRPEPGLAEACEELRRQVEGLDGLLGDGSDMFEDTRGGDDRLNGGEGNDSLWGDAVFMSESATGGADRFAFAPGSDLDRILDFEQGKDKIDVRAYGITAAQVGQHVQGNVVDFDRTAADVDEVRVFALGDVPVPVTLAVGDFIFA